jgi:hypothetical protein
MKLATPSDPTVLQMAENAIPGTNSSRKIQHLFILLE